MDLGGPNTSQNTLGPEGDGPFNTDLSPPSGEYSAPSLSAQPSTVVASGGNVSIFCGSWETWDTFHLLKEGGADPPRSMKSEGEMYSGRWHFKAIFPVGPVIPSHGGTYRCYGSSSSYPKVWTQPSAPLHIEVTGEDRPAAPRLFPGPNN